jgi:AbrB family looped-hinge helix DNA binding protein
MSTITKKRQVAIPKPFRDRLHIKEGDSLHFEVKDNVLILRRNERRSLLDLGGIARGRKVGTGSEREYAKRTAARKIAKEGR